jgi:hypothetical protein
MAVMVVPVMVMAPISAVRTAITRSAVAVVILRVVAVERTQAAFQYIGVSEFAGENLAPPNAALRANYSASFDADFRDTVPIVSVKNYCGSTYPVQAVGSGFIVVIISAATAVPRRCFRCPKTEKRQC